jgi:DhnA family fructose-bisphosphate aldolase class Ia
MTQNDFAQLVSAAHAQLGFTGAAGVQVGRNVSLHSPKIWKKPF